MKEKNLHKIAQNTRFLILPMLKSLTFPPNSSPSGSNASGRTAPLFWPSPLPTRNLRQSKPLQRYLSILLRLSIPTSYTTRD
jgi:hypothetical protein